MAKKILLLLEVLFLTLTISAGACNKNLTLKKGQGVREQLKRENTTYIILYDFDLNGETIKIPRNCCLHFEGGKFLNGSIIGDRTKVKSEAKRIFERIALTGSWDNREVYSEWFDFVEGKEIDNSQNFINMMTSCVSEKMTHLYMQAGNFYCSAISESSNIRIPSNVYWHNSATIIQLSTSCTKYGFVLLQNSQNVIIEGGEFVGDVKTHIGKDGEWGHGIKVAGAKNILLKNIIVREFWGDGIDLIEALDSKGKPTIDCENVTISGVKCDANRRQGLSIESGKRIVITDSEFINTGKYGRTAPGSGIDIEPWNDDSDKIQNIKISRCKLLNNWGYDLQLYANFKKMNPEVLDNIIKISDCVIGRSYAYKTKGVTFRRCQMNMPLKKKDSFNILIR